MPQGRDSKLVSLALASDVVEFNTEHRAELVRIRALPASEQEKEFSAFMNNEIDRVLRMPPQLQDKEFAIIIAAETDRIVGLSPERQKDVIATKYGMDPVALENSYMDLRAKAAELQRRDNKATTLSTIAGWGAALATVAATIIPFNKNGSNKTLLKRFHPESKLLQGMFVGLLSIAMGIASSLVSARIFGKAIKEESKNLAIEARNAFERDVAGAVENTVLATVATRAKQGVVAEENVINATLRKPPVIEPRAGFAAELAKEKSAKTSTPAI